MKPKAMKPIMIEPSLASCVDELATLERTVSAAEEIAITQRAKLIEARKEFWGKVRAAYPETAGKEMKIDTKTYTMTEL